MKDVHLPEMAYSASNIFTYIMLNCDFTCSTRSHTLFQCEQCFTWQHGDCVNLTVQTVPKNYLCYICLNPKGMLTHVSTTVA